MGILQFDQPRTIAVKRNGRWQLAGAEVSLSDNRIVLQTDRASWVRITWQACFSAHARVLGDAWERSYADLRWKPVFEPAFHPWYFAVLDDDGVTCCGVKTGPAALCSWQVNETSVTLLMDVRCGCADTQFDGRKLGLAELVLMTGQGHVFGMLRDFCRKMCDTPVLPGEPVYGGNDWYNAYGSNSFASVVDHAALLAECAKGLANRPYQVVDAGWTSCFSWGHPAGVYIGGPYGGCNSKFGDMKRLADEIRALDVRPGIWFRPLETVEYVPQEAVLRRETQDRTLLDPSHPLVKEKTAEDIERFLSWGYAFIKHDFAVVDMLGHYAFDMTESVVEGGWSFHEKNKTTAEITREYYERTAKLARHAVIDACNTFSHLSAGVFGIYRIGDDVSGTDYRRTVTMGVNTLAFRGVQHNTFYAADPDCVPITGKVPWEKTEQWLNLVKYSGMPFMVSVEKQCDTDRIRDVLTEAFAVVSRPHETAEPIDWLDTELPVRWKTFDGEKEFVWDYQ